jgi:hypothetical protein
MHSYIQKSGSILLHTLDTNLPCDCESLLPVT